MSPAYLVTCSQVSLSTEHHPFLPRDAVAKAFCTGPSRRLFDVWSAGTVHVLQGLHPLRCNKHDDPWQHGTVIGAGHKVKISVS